MSFFLVLFLVLCFVALVLSWLYPRLTSFGKAPRGERRERILRSPNYVQGRFQNETDRGRLAEGVSEWHIYRDFFLGKRKNTRPESPMPSQKTDLHNLPRHEDVLVWFGHSSYFLQLSGQRFLVDPVFSGAASPFPFFTRAFEGADIYTPEDMPEIDCLLITHDHWDHLDYETLRALRHKVDTVVCGLGVGAHLEHWGYAPQAITELDWHDSVALRGSITVHARPTHHFSGRGACSNPTLWVSFVLQTPWFVVYLGGDSGFGPHFAAIGEEFGGVDVAVLENGQYDKRWPYSHMHPQEVMRAAVALGARTLFPGHTSKFDISYHPWKEPLETIVHLPSEGIRLITPMIGQKVLLHDTAQTFPYWWEHVE